MDYIEGLQTSFGDAFITLPLLLIGVSFFFGTLTSNTGLLYLFLGQLLFVPAIQFALNETGRPWKDAKDSSQTDFVRLIKWAISLLSVGVINSAPYDKSWQAITRIVITSLTTLVQIVINNQIPSPVTSTTCSMIPRPDSTDTIYSSPTSWTGHIVFFCSFVFANAMGIYNEPAPQINASTDQEKEQRQQSLDDRVTNRKWISGAIMGVSILVLILLLFFRYKFTPCESGFFRSLPGLITLFISGNSFYNLIYTYCGVRPADVLGIVNGLINPDLIDNPIVCVGS
jgi:hypothetical protein